MTDQLKPSIATGATLTEETFKDFIERIKYHSEGDGVKWHGTSDAIFIVQSKEVIYGFDQEYFNDKLAVINGEGSVSFSPKEYWDGLEKEEKRKINIIAKGRFGETFLNCFDFDQWDILEELPDHRVTGWDIRWSYVNAHFTKEAAEAFIKRKAHDYDELRIYVHSECYAWEFNAIKEALMNGQIVWNKEVTQ